MTKKEQPVRVFLIRCWHEGLPDGNGQWRFAVEFVDGRDGRFGFSDLHKLVHFLQNDLGNQGEFAHKKGDDTS